MQLSWLHKLPGGLQLAMDVMNDVIHTNAMWKNFAAELAER